MICKFSFVYLDKFFYLLVFFGFLFLDDVGNGVIILCVEEK